MNNYVDFQHLGFLFSQKKECKYLKDYLVTKWTLGVTCVSASYHPKINLGPNTRTRVVPSKFNTREDYKSKDCKKIEYVITTCRLTRWETKPWYQKIGKKTNKQTKTRTMSTKQFSAAHIRIFTCLLISQCQDCNHIELLGTLVFLFFCNRKWIVDTRLTHPSSPPGFFHSSSSWKLYKKTMVKVCYYYCY